MHWTRSMHSANYGSWNVAFCLYLHSLHRVAWLHMYISLFLNPWGYIYSIFAILFHFVKCEPFLSYLCLLSSFPPSRLSANLDVIPRKGPEIFTLILIGSDWNDENTTQSHFTNGIGLSLVFFFVSFFIFFVQSILLSKWRIYSRKSENDLHCFHHFASQKGRRNSQPFTAPHLGLIVTMEMQLLAPHSCLLINWSSLTHIWLALRPVLCVSKEVSSQPGTRSLLIPTRWNLQGFISGTRRT